MQTPRYQNTYSLGQIIQVIGVFLSVGGLVWYQSGVQAETRVAIDGLNRAVVKLDTTLGPLVSNDKVQDEQIRSLSLAMQDIRNTSMQLLLQISGVREDLAVLKSQQRK